MTSSVLKKLAVVTFLLLLAWVAYIIRLVPREQTPFEKASLKTASFLLEQGGRKVHFRKEGQRWKVSGASEAVYDADENSANALFSAIKGLQIDDEISSRADRAADYDVTPASGTTVRLQDAKGGALAAGLIGKQAPDMAHIYFRYLDKPNVYIARGLSRGDLGQVEVNYWRSRQLIDIPETKFRGITIEGKGYKTDLQRVSTDTWTTNGQPASPAPINALVGVLAHLHADSFIDGAPNPSYGFDALKEARVRVTGEGSSVELRFGALDAAAKRYPVSAGPQAGAAWISEATVKTILQKPSSFILKK